MQTLTQQSAPTYLDILLTAVSSRMWTPNKRYAKLGRYLLAFTSKQMATYVEIGQQVTKKPAREPDFLEAMIENRPVWGWIDDGDGSEVKITICYPLFCRTTRYELVAKGSPKEVYRRLAEREGWPVEGEELVAEAMPLSKAPPPDPEALRLAVWAAALGRRTWVARSPNDIAIVVGGIDIGEEWVVRGRVVIDRSSGYRLRRYVYEVVDWDYLAQNKRRVYVIERGDIAYILGGYKALKYDGAIKEVDLAEVPVEALEKIAARRRR